MVWSIQITVVHIIYSGYTARFRINQDFYSFRHIVRVHPRYRLIHPANASRVGRYIGHRRAASLHNFSSRRNTTLRTWKNEIFQHTHGWRKKKLNKKEYIARFFTRNLKFDSFPVGRAYRHKTYFRTGTRRDAFLCCLYVRCFPRNDRVRDRRREDQGGNVSLAHLKSREATPPPVP